MSATAPEREQLDVRFVPEADIASRPPDVRFTPKSGHRLGAASRDNKRHRRSFGGKVLTCPDQFGTGTVGIRHFDYATEIISSFGGITDAECGLRRTVVAA